MPGTPIAVKRTPTEKNLSWGEVDWLVEVAVSEMRRRRFQPARIVPIGGGGIIPASIMAYRFYKKDHTPIELMAPVYAKSYTPDHKQHDLHVAWPDFIEDYDNADTLFVDDILDTGATWRAVKARMPKSSFYSMVTKIDGHPNWFSTRDMNNYWWNFPWEKVPQDVQG